MYFRGLSLSALIHGILFWALWYLPTAPSKPEWIQIELKEHDGTIIMQPNLKADLLDHQKEDDKSKAKYLSREKVRVKKNSQANATGITKNVFNPSVSGSNQKGEKSSEKNYDNSDIVDYRKPNLKIDPFSISRLNESLNKDIPIGSFTALDTDPYLYFSFFDRLNPILRNRWEQNIRNAIQKIITKSKSGNPNKEWITVVNFVLDEKGEFISADLNQGSGIGELDSAAIDAFRLGAPYPNPPKDMVKEDGKIHLKYSFRVQWDPKAM